MSEQVPTLTPISHSGGSILGSCAVVASHDHCAAAGPSRSSLPQHAAGRPQAGYTKTWGWEIVPRSLRAQPTNTHPPGRARNRPLVRQGGYYSTFAQVVHPQTRVSPLLPYGRRDEQPLQVVVFLHTRGPPPLQLSGDRDDQPRRVWSEGRRHPLRHSTNRGQWTSPRRAVRGEKAIVLVCSCFQREQPNADITGQSSSERRPKAPPPPLYRGRTLDEPPVHDGSVARRS